MVNLCRRRCRAMILFLSSVLCASSASSFSPLPLTTKGRLLLLLLSTSKTTPSPSSSSSSSSSALYFSDPMTEQQQPIAFYSNSAFVPAPIDDDDDDDDDDKSENAAAGGAADPVDDESIVTQKDHQDGQVEEGSIGRDSRKSSSSLSNNKRDAFMSLSVTDLKRLLVERDIDFRDCLEKRDLVERLRENGGDGDGFDPQKDVSSSSSSRRQNNNPTGLSDAELSRIETFKRVSPSVANIQTTAVVSQRRRGLQLRPMEVPLGTGSGFLWDNDGHVVTNYHVVSAGQPQQRSGSGTTNNGANNPPYSKTVKVKLSGMAHAVDADVVGVEPEKDLAVLKVKQSHRLRLPRPISVGTSNDLQVGQSVLAIGNPFGLDDTLTLGIVSALGRDVDGIGGRPIHNCIQTDAAINQGNSGGPLLDSRGRLIGVNTAIFSPNGRAGGNVGIGFAIPVDTVRRVVQQLIQHGKVIRPTLGISVVDDRLKRSMEEQLGQTLNGCLVAQVVPNSPAVVAGIEACRMGSGGGSIAIGSSSSSSFQLGDLITEIDGETVTQAEDLISAVEEKKEGDFVTLRVLRRSDPRRAEYIKVKLTTRDKLDDSNNNNNNKRSSFGSSLSSNGSNGSSGGRNGRLNSSPWQ